MNVYWKRFLLSSLFLLYFHEVFAEQEIYRWTDKQGNVHYGDKTANSKDAENITDEINDKKDIYLSETGHIPIDKIKHGRNVSKYLEINKINHPLPFTTYLFQKALWSKGNYNKLAFLDDSLWITGNKGLFEFDTISQELFLFDKSTGLPINNARDIIADKGRLFIEFYDKSNMNFNFWRYFWFIQKENRFIETEKSLIQIKAGGNYTTKNSDVMRNQIFDTLFYQDKIWLTSRESKRYRKKGGVAVLNPLTKRGRQYTKKDGLAHADCNVIIASENNSVWVSHFQPNRGLSVLYEQNQRWIAKKNSLNGTELGGTKIVAINHYILIIQFKALVIYDKKSDLAYTLEIPFGHPGTGFFTDIIFNNNVIWVAASSKSLSQTGIIKIELHEIDKLFTQMQNKYK